MSQTYNPTDMQAVIDFVWDNPHSNFYRTLWRKKAGLTEKPLVTSAAAFADIIPIITKADIQTYDDPDKRCFIPHHEKRCLLSTSGTSGTPLFLWRRGYQYAPYTKEIQQSGGQRHLHTWSYHRMAPISVIAGYTTGLEQLNADPRLFTQLETTLAMYRPDSIAASPSILLFIRDNLKDKSLLEPIRYITLQGEPLTEASLQLLQHHFPTAAFYNVLGMSEAGCDVFFNTPRCATSAQTMHVATEQVFTEIMADQSIVLTTTTLPHALPLIRYSAGDRGDWVSESCACGNPAPQVTLLGRVDVDMVRIQGFEIRVDTLDMTLAALQADLEPIMHATVTETVTDEHKQVHLHIDLVQRQSSKLDVSALATQVHTALLKLPLSSQTTLQAAINAGLFDAPSITINTTTTPTLKNKTIRILETS